MNTCIDCNKPIKKNQTRCWDCHKKNVEVSERFCADCGIKLPRYGKGIRCAKCMRVFNSSQAKIWKCIDCGETVPRRTKRCPVCHRAFLNARPTYERTPEHKELMSKATSGPHPWRIGFRHSQETKEKMASHWTEEKREESRQRGKRMAENKEWLMRIAHSLSGENNPMWQGGIANGQYAPGFCKTLKERIRSRDNYTCQLCGITEEETGYRLSIHHADYDKSNHSESNLFATCKRCNSFVNTRRVVWTAYFLDLAKRRQLL